MARTAQRVLSPAQVRRRKELPPVDSVIQHLNSVLDDPLKREAARANASVGGWFHIIVKIRLTPQEAYDLQERCRSAKWPGGQVVVWQNQTSVVLQPHINARWESAYDGKPLDKVLAKAA